jgi:hypothetical protein
MGGIPGKREWDAFIAEEELREGRCLSPKQLIRAYCYDCMGFFEDGVSDCNNVKCPLYAYMPANANKKKKNHPGASKEHMAVIREAKA